MLTTFEEHGLEQIALINLQISRLWRRALLAIAMLLVGCVGASQLSPEPTTALRATKPAISLTSTNTGQPTMQVNEGTAEIQPTIQISATNPEEGSLDDLGSFEKWNKVEIDLIGPALADINTASERVENILTVTFSGPNGQEYHVPAFYVGDNEREVDITAWKVRFSPPTAGEWTFSVNSSNNALAQQNGSFSVDEPSNCMAEQPSILPAFECLGRLIPAGGHYLKFTEGGYWIKGGIDDPENFLGDAFGDWAAKKAAVDYLSSKGVNSIYVITNNIDGDNQDTWPWIGDTPAQAKQNSNQFDSAKLDAWEDFFSYVQSKGIVLHIVLNDDSAWVGYNPTLYFQEMIARFGHHPALIWNIGEEANESFSTNEQLMLASLMQSLDPYNHPVTIHRKSPWPFLGEKNFDLTSIQPGDGASNFSNTKLADYNTIVSDHRGESVDLCHGIPIMIDETPRVTEVNPALQLKMRSGVLYPIYLAGGNYEMHYFDAYGQGGGLTVQELTPMLEDMYYARQFIENLPIHSMSPCNQLLGQSQGTYCFGKNGEIYAVYKSSGGEIDINLSGVSGTFIADWYNPRSGVTSGAGVISGGAVRTLQTPDSQDWALLLVNQSVSLDALQENNSMNFNEIQWIDFDGAAIQFAFLPLLMTC